MSSESETFKNALNSFAGGKSLNPESIKIDGYLIFPDCDSVGVKIRQNKLEIKALQSMSRPLSINVGHKGSHISIKGRTDRWVRWSFDLVEGLKKSFESGQLYYASKAVAAALKGTDSWF